MGIRFSCPNGHKLHVKEHLAGKRAICPSCGAKLIVPSASESQEPVAPQSNSGVSTTQSAHAAAPSDSQSVVIAVADQPIPPNRNDNVVNPIAPPAESVPRLQEPPPAAELPPPVVREEIPPAQTVSKYVAHRQRTRRRQTTVAILLLMAVVVLAVVLIWVLQSGPTTSPRELAWIGQRQMHRIASRLPCDIEPRCPFVIRV